MSMDMFISGNLRHSGDIFVNGDSPVQSSIHSLLAQQGAVHLAGNRLNANPKHGAHELVWLADHILAQHVDLGYLFGGQQKHVSPSELYQQIGGRSYLIGLLTVAVWKTTPGGAWWTVSQRSDAEIGVDSGVGSESYAACKALSPQSASKAWAPSISEAPKAPIPGVWKTAGR